MNFTVLPLKSPPLRRRTLLPSAPERAAKDHSGLVDAAMISTFTPSQVGAFMGSRKSIAAAAAAPSSTRATRLSGPVTESNGLRERIGSAFVLCPPAPVADGAVRACSGGSESCLSSAARLEPTSWVRPRAFKNAAVATSTSSTAQKLRLRI